ncbi:hypothetical protein [Flavobacterium rhizosphaerae]|uniref:Minor tail protein n=1 Tax=Flavobacterium rhizosphaerae TaxID=3163298 RepID=A0ABW8YYX0_9FLAO
METKSKSEPVMGSAAVENTNSGFHFRTPADIKDFGAGTSEQAEMDSLWSANLDGFTQQGMLSNRWNTSNTPPTTNYYNPVQNNPASTVIPVNWSAFPGRLAYNYPTATQSQLNEMADTGAMSAVMKNPADISNNPCGTATEEVPYFPYGPRGWQDEYCEWAVTRNSAGKITRIDFTCENPEYWNSLWMVNPDRVVQLYQQILNKPQITIQDLSLPNAANPVTGGPVYNPLNKWNSGTVSNSTQGGAIHLTSTPNTLQTEIGLATAATVQRNNRETGNTFWPSSQFNDLLCYAQYGQRDRNSDPNIGGNVNQVVNGASVGGPKVVTLADPPGLYIQMPDFSNYQTPDGTPASKFWRIVRGSETLNDQSGAKLPGNFILHAVFEVPDNYPYTVEDIKISGQNIAWGSQVAATFKMQIVASAYDATSQPQGYDAVGDLSPSYAQPLQFFYKDYFEAMYNTAVPNPVNHPIPLLSNSTYVPSVLFRSANNLQMVLTCDTRNVTPGDASTYPTVSFDDTNITAVVNDVKEVSYAVPGNSQPSTYKALYLTVNVGLATAIGPRAVFVTNKGQDKGTPMPALFNVAPTIVRANIKWQNTGVNVTAGTPVAITYQSGLWTANPEFKNLYDAAGNPLNIKAKPGYTLPGANEGALVGRVGGEVFLVGMGARVPGGLSGALELCINDDLNGIYGAGFTDNIGSITVAIHIG